MDTTPGFDAPAPDPVADTRSDARLAESYAEVEDALLSRWPETKLDPTLDRIEAFMELLGDPQRTYPVIHLTGTNGKTSTARMIETLIATLGLRVGRFTSPHLESMTERISLDGEPMDEEAFVTAFNDVAPYTHLVDQEHDHPLSFFETVVGHGVRRLRGCSGRRSRRRGRHGRHLGRDQRGRRERRRAHARSRSTMRSTSARRRRSSPRRRSASSSPAPPSISAVQSRRGRWR